MDIDSVTNIFFQILGGGESFLDSTVFLVIKIVIGIYVIVLFIDLVLLLILRGLKRDIRHALGGADIPSVSRSKMQRKWEKIRGRLANPQPSQHKVAILEADKIVDDILLGIGYKGNNMEERLEEAKIGNLEGLDELQNAHKVRNQIIHDENFSLEKQKAREILDIYEEFLRKVEFL